MDLVTLDIETYFSDDYTLRKLTTEEYVRDPRFKIHCVGYKINNGPVQVSAGVPALDWPNCAVVCHNAAFDMFALSHHLGVRPGFILDTLSMARLVYPHERSHSLESLVALLLRSSSPKNVPYQLFKGQRDLSPDILRQLMEGCRHDVELTHGLFTALLASVPPEELRVIDLTIRMFTEPALTLDRPRLEAELQKIKSEKEQALSNLGVTKSQLQSAEIFSGLLRAQGVEPPTKPSPSNPEKQIYAFSKTDEEFKALQEHDSPVVQALVAARLGQKSTLGETRAQRLLDMDTRGPLPVFLKYCGAHTTRWSGGDKVNWQNFTKGSELRKSIIAPPGYVLVVGDSSQIECRLLNWKAGQHDVLEAFKTGRDLYSEGASRFYGRPISKEDKQQRHLGKTLELGCGYGMGADKFQVTCRRGALGGAPILLTGEEAKRAVDSYRSSHPRVRHLWKEADRVLRNLVARGPAYRWGACAVIDGKIVGPNLTKLDYTNVYSDGHDFYKPARHGGATKVYGALLVENVVQYLSRLVLSQAMLKISTKYKIVMCTHDEVVVLARENEADEALEFVLNTLRTPPEWCNDIPLDAEGGYARNYSK